MTCPSCGAMCAATALYCPACGNRLSGATGSGARTMPVGGQGAPPTAGNTGPQPVASSVAAPPLAPGTVLQGRYRIECVLGEGAFGRVYLATDLQDPGGPPVAVKELLDKPTATPEEQREAIAWFKREVSTLLTLEHPGIPAIYSYWTARVTAGPYFLVMQYIPGQSLEELARGAGGQLPWPRVAAWGIALCEVLEYLHDRPTPIVFRDLKPSNVMIDSRDDRPRLIDFGIARQLAQPAGTTIGTPGYAPFEQWLGKAEARSDLYALGALLHALLTGRSPETEYTRLRNTRGYDVETALRVLFPPVDALVPGVPAALAHVLTRATAFAKEDRFADAAAMAAALRAVAPGVAPWPLTPGAASVARMPTIVAPPPPRTPPPPPPLAAPPTPRPAAVAAGGRSGARRLALVATAAVVIASGGAGLWIERGALGFGGQQRASTGLLATSTAAATAIATPPSQTATPPSQTATPPPPTATLPPATPTSPAATPTVASPATATPPAAPTAVPPGRATPISHVSGVHTTVRWLALYVNAASRGFSGVNLRARPSTAAPLLMLIPDNARLQARRKTVIKANGTLWYSVRYGSRSGYALAALLSRRRPAPVRAMWVSAYGLGYTGVNVRAAPSLGARFITGVDNGLRLYVLGQPVWGANNEYWYRVAYLGQLGYARAPLLSTRKPPPIGEMYVNAAGYGYTGVDVRSAPRLDAPVVLELYNGWQIQTVGRPVLGGNGEYWYLVVGGYKVGYARAMLLSRRPPGS